MVTASAPGKLVLLGEYAVLRGAPAVVAAVDRRAKVEVGEPDGGAGPPGLRLDAPQIGVHGARLRFPRAGEALGPEQLRGRPLGVVEAVVYELEVRHGVAAALGERSVHIDTSSFFEGDNKLGIGSSAAVSVATAAALAAAAGLELEPAELFQLCLAAHRRAQGPRGSGVDVAASVFGGVSCYRADRIPQPLALPAGFGFVPVFSGRSTSTPDFVERVLAAVDGGGAAAAAFAALHAAADAGARAAAGADSERLLAAVRAFAEAYAELGRSAGVELWSDEHAAIAAVVAACHCVYKPSGAGGGDLGVAFYHSPAVLSSLECALADARFDVVPLRLADVGVEVA